MKTVGYIPAEEKQEHAEKSTNPKKQKTKTKEMVAEVPKETEQTSTEGAVPKKDGEE